MDKWLPETSVSAEWQILSQGVKCEAKEPHQKHREVQRKLEI